MNPLVVVYIFHFDQGAGKFLIVKGIEHVVDHVVVYFIRKPRADLEAKIDQSQGHVDTHPVFAGFQVTDVNMEPASFGPGELLGGCAWNRSSLRRGFLGHGFGVRRLV
jgi:hypothetical protein